ncbi:39S ribosomal protein L33, mitochondrial-like, partial [Puntigrus tetrazona]|uniref:39S ribosomal protein L33, mitochondrial-like n=1 Tax=Puntigrus tetrazona TaxID=1606681 RepID=UPI001C892D48
KSKSKTLLVQMVSAAGTGYCFNTKRGRLRDKLVLRKHDPIGEVKSLCHCKENGKPQI